VARITQLTPRIKSVVVTPSRPFRFTAGQHVDIRLTAPDGYQALRSYSIASSPETAGTIELAVERLDDGEVSPFLHDILAVGDEIELRGPLGGHFVWSRADGGPLLLLGGGSGVVPLVSMVRCLRDAGISVPMVLLLSARRLAEAAFHDELTGLARKIDQFWFFLSLTREASSQADFARRIDAPMVSEVLRPLPSLPAHVFICGSNSFVNAASDGALSAGIPAATIKTERYGG
jgi:ferredoxin-NADP reductase